MDPTDHASTADRPRRRGRVGLTPGRLSAKRPSWKHLVLLVTLWAVAPPTRAAPRSAPATHTPRTPHRPREKPVAKPQWQVPA